MNGVKIDANRIGDLENLYKTVQKHTLSSLVSVALQKAGIQTKVFCDTLNKENGTIAKIHPSQSNKQTESRIVFER